MVNILIYLFLGRGALSSEAASGSGNDFYKLNGPALLTSILSEQSHSLRLRKKALTLATDLQISEKEYDIKSFSDKRFADLLMSLLKSGEMDMNEKSLLMIQSLIQHNPGTREHFRGGLQGSVASLLKDIEKLEKSLFAKELVSLAETVLKDLYEDEKEL